MRKLKRIIATFLLFILFINNIVIAKEEINWDEEIIYFILTDRFYDGDKTNNDVYGKDSYDINHLEAYHGGDFQGIIDKIDYLKDLGITTLWITPIVKNIETNIRADKADKQYGYHGYWAEDFTKIDPHLGDEEKLMELVDVLAENGIKLMVDVVINHAGYGMNHSSQFEGMIRDNPGSDDITGELAGLPDFITEDQSVREKLINWQLYWINKKSPKGNSISYFRVDTVKHVEHETWKDFKEKIIDINPKFKLIGEVFDASITNTRGYLDKDMMDSLLDFEFKKIAYDFSKGRFEEIDKKLNFRNQKLNENLTMGQFLSSHDEHGFLKMRLNDDKNLFKPVVSLQLTSKGQPVIYYGEEIGMSGRKDDFSKGIYSENRKSFDWDNKDTNLLDHYKNLIEIRKEYKDIFSKGDRKLIYTDDDVYVFERNYDGEIAIIALNISEDKKNIEINNEYDVNKFVDIYNKKSVKNDDTIKLNVPGNKDGGTAILVDRDSIDDDIYIEESVQFRFWVMIGFIGISTIMLYISIKNRSKRQ